MASYVRKNAWNNGGTLEQNDSLYWYAKGVEKMMSRALDDKASWWFFGGIHDVDFAMWATVNKQPNIPLNPKPDAETQKVYWKQCQHGSWYFLPWHRGYLIALEKQLRADIVSLKGPATWALPYWNYFGGGKENNIPPAFNQKTLVDRKTGKSTPNPLYVIRRFGPNNDGNVYMPLGNSGRELNLDCQDKSKYTNSSMSAEYGGGITGFSHGGRAAGANESNPHNNGHVNVGGTQTNPRGLMSYNEYAAMDPVFYMHHCEIDRLWASWNSNGGPNPKDDKWLKGPAYSGGRAFIMPLPNGGKWVYTPGDVNSLDLLDYSYEKLSSTTLVPQVQLFSQRLNKLGVQHDLQLLQKGTKMDNEPGVELLGSHTKKLDLKDSKAGTRVKFDSKPLKRIGESLKNASVDKAPDRIYLELDNVTGNHDGNFLHVSANGKRIGSKALFGLNSASKKDDHHAGSGLRLVFDITDLIDELHLSGDLDSQDGLDITIETEAEVPSDHKIHVGKISLFRESQG